MGSTGEPAPEVKYSKPLGIRFIEHIKRSSISYKTHQILVLVITFFAYLTYHATRKTTSVVKSALDPQSPDVDLLSPFSWRRAYAHKPLEKARNSWVLGAGWEPFNGSDGTALLGELDVAFLFVYAIGMYFSGHVGDRMDLRVFLTIGMVGTGLFTALFGVGYWANIHFFYYYLIVQMLAGLFQSTGWPSVVAVVGNWFGKRKRGLIMGIWNAHTSLGNITGSVVASMLLKYGWGWSLVVPGLGITFVGLVLFLFLPVSPETVGVSIDEDEVLSPKKEGDETTVPLLSTKSDDRDAVGFLQAWRIPGVASFSLCLFFAKLVAYTFLYWLPFYISHTAIEGRYLSSEESGNLSTMFDVGGVIGGILAGHISDRLDARAITAASFMYCAIPALFFYRSYGHISMTINVILMVITGMFVNAPYALITTAVSADLGTHSSLKGNSRALATVTAIIDGTGSIGAAVGPLLTGYISANSWSAVFTMLMGSALIAGLLLTRLVMAEVASKIQGARPQELPRSTPSELDV
ncbi:putative glycerol-3-phosphate transporter 1 [Perilla frutescens var. hirtella]|uniref:Glycerol-3-phosphate transporter 1 n=1 Tax=Perilla frutescens var. hirtella TaxID=608512 RepID=A0AAD4NY05_PERFH|nr:putative glycerol-3-phosphate transporter 1 [Perilla frutescens var. hirtella]